MYEFSFIKGFGPACEIVKHPFNFIAFNFKTARDQGNATWFDRWFWNEEEMEAVLWDFIENFIGGMPADNAEFNVLVQAMIAQFTNGNAAHFLLGNKDELLLQYEMEIADYFREQQTQ